MKLLYCYIKFLDDTGNTTLYHGLDHVELSLSTTNIYKYDLANNILKREVRSTPLPEDFWMNGEHIKNNIYNINVISGENGSGKTTVMRCLLTMLRFFHDVVDASIDKTHWQGYRNSAYNIAFLLLETEGSTFFLEYIPTSTQYDEHIKLEGFGKDTPHIYVCRHWKEFAEQGNKYRDIIADCLLKLKVIHMTNTLNQYDYECHIGEKKEIIRDSFVYDVSIGAIIGQDVGQFFLYEVYKQVKYIFDKNQKEKRINIPEIKMPLTLTLHLRVNQYKQDFLRSFFPFIGGKEGDDGFIPINEIDLATLLGLLCVSAFADNLGIRIKDGSLPLKRKTPNEYTSQDCSVMEELKQVIQELERWFYKSIQFPVAQGHDGTIYCIKELPNCKIVSGSYDKTLRIWDVDTGNCLQIMTGHKYSISCITILDNGQIVSGSNDGTLRVWEPSTGICINILKAETDAAITCIETLPNGRVVCGTYDGIVQIWDINNAQRVQTLVGHHDKITCLSVFSDGRIVSGSEDCIIRVWDGTTGRCIWKFRDHEKAITCIRVLSNGKIISGSADCTIRAWESITGQCLCVLYGHKRPITCISVLPNEHIVSGSCDGSIRIWDISSKDEHNLVKIQGHNKEIMCIAVHPNGSIISGSKDGTLCVWDGTTGFALQTLKGHTNSITCIEILQNGKVVSGSEDRALCIWDIETGECLHKLRSYYRDKTNMVVLSDGRVDSIHNGKNTSIRTWKTKEKMQNNAKYAARSLAKCCQEYLDFLEEKQNSFFLRFIKEDQGTYKLSLDAIKKSDYQDMVDFIQKYRYTCEPAYTIDFDWGLSSGEENLLRLFSNLYHIFDRDYSSGRYGDYKIYNNETHASEDKQKTECNTVLLLMDEADLTLHPEWQRRLIAILTSFIPQIYPATCVKDIQLILSTHSPLLLGDIPGENITYLFTNKSREGNPLTPRYTFGQNIHTILKDSFFLKDGTVGAFAAKKINMMAKRLCEIKECSSSDMNLAALQKSELEDIHGFIGVVAPGVLRKRLEELYEEAIIACKKREDGNNINDDQLHQMYKKLSPRTKRQIQSIIIDALKQETNKDD